MVAVKSVSLRSSSTARRRCGWLLALSVAAVSLTSCGTLAARAQPVATGLQPISDGWSFPNFPSEALPEYNFDEIDMVAMFGSESEICVDGVDDPCVLTAEAAAWAQMINQARASGHCQGLAVVAAGRFNESLSPQTATLPFATSEVRLVARAFALQFVPEAQQEVAESLSLSLKEKIDLLSQAFESGLIKHTVGLYTASAGHTVTPFALEYPDDSTARIMVYDSNWPGRNRYIDVDLKNERWVFSFASDSPELDSNPWSGGTGDFDLTSVALQDSTCPFCSSAGEVKNTTLVVRTDSDDWSIESEGLVLTAESRGIINGAQVNTVKAASSRSVFEYVIQLPGRPSQSEATRGFSLKFPGTASVFAQLPNGVARIQTSPKASAPVVLSGNAITTSDPEVALSMSSGNFVASVQGAAASLSAETDSLNVAIALPNGEIIQRQVEEGQSALKVESDSANGEVLIQQSTSTGKDQLIAINSAGEQRVLDVVVPLGPPSVVVDLPVSLESKSNAELPPIEQRDTANPNYRTDSNYVAPKVEPESLASDTPASTNVVTKTTPVPESSTTTLVSSGGSVARTAPPT
ncbi:MAG: hypothetical protein EBV17_04285, partial [Actinobacteria bacterium]|nr:hypothetical protein [Actinomycetota bacterium]